MNGQLPIFKPNNHSRYEIKWKSITAGIENDLKKLIADNYGFEIAGAIQEVDEWERMSNNFRVKVSRNGTAAEVIFRKHIQLQDENSIRLLDQVLDFLLGQGMKVPVVVLTKNKEKYFKSGGNFYQLYEFIPGDHFRGTTDELRVFAQSLAQLHKVFLTLPFKGQIEEKHNVLPAWDTAGWQKILSVAKNKTGKFEAIINEQTPLILGAIDAVTKNAQVLAGARVQVIRGDLHPHDTLYANGGLNAIIDFEGVRVGELVREVGNACHRFVRQFVVFQNHDWQRALPEGIKIFLSAYQSVNQLSDQEIKLIPIFIQDELLRKLFKDLNLYFFKNSPANIEGGELEKKLILLKEAPMFATYM